MRAGVTLIELTVSAALMMLLMGSLATIFHSGSRYFYTMNTLSDLQRACLVGANRIGSEIAEGNLQAVLEDGTQTGVVFASPRDRVGEVRFNGQNEMLWQQFICYWVEPVPGASGKLMRQYQFLTPINEPPLPTNGPPYFKALPPSPNTGISSMVCENIYYLDVVRNQNIELTLAAKDASGEYRISVKTIVHARN